VDCWFDTLYDSKTRVVVMGSRYGEAANIPRLGPGESIAFPCSGSWDAPAIGGMSWTKARITIQVDYRILGIPIDRARFFGFLGVIGGDGILRWVAAQPVPHP
jgi:hypothetical protein